MPDATTIQMEASPADQWSPRHRRRRCGCCHGVNWGRVVCTAVVLLVVGLAVGGLAYLITVSTRYPVYSASIDAVSDLELDHATDLVGRAPTLDPVFNLSIRLSSQNRASNYPDCILPGTTVEVTYRGVQLAVGSVEQLCVGARETKEQHVVACGAGVRLPGFALDALAADARRGAEAFDVAVKIPNIVHRGYHGHGHVHLGTLVSCRGRRVGDDPVAALRTPCHASSADIAASSYPNKGTKQPGGAS
uniref:Late embryogenesis abundant protein LEA-2 subgroup domain-containing protein n=1 Tax=Oryza punctata TaxID=4537 RepID=A0A0E0K2I0_ORYPU